MILLQNGETAKVRQIDLLFTQCQRNPHFHNQLVSHLYDTEKPVQKYPQWKCSFTDIRIFELCLQHKQTRIIAQKSDASYCQESIAFFHIFIFQTTEVPAVSTLDHGGLKFSRMGDSVILCGCFMFYVFVHMYAIWDITLPSPDENTGGHGKTSKSHRYVSVSSLRISSALTPRSFRFLIS